MKELLTGNLPVTFLIGGREYHISSDFRAMLRLEEIFSSEELTDEEKALCREQVKFYKKHSRLIE